MSKDTAKKSVDFKQRNPTVWLVLSLLVPFFFFYWLASRHKQINQLSGSGPDSKPPIRMSPWWPLSLLIVTVALLVGAVVVAIVGQVDVDRYSTSPVPAASAHSEVYYPDEAHDHPLVDGSTDSTFDGDKEVQSIVDAYVEALIDDRLNEDESVHWGFFVLYFLGLLTSLATSIVLFFYLLQHTDGIVKLAGSDNDKTFLVVMAAIGCFVLPLLLAAVLYRSQSVINRAIAAA